MSREIKFRGKRTDNGDWVFGAVYYSDYGGVKATYILEHGETIWYSRSDRTNLGGIPQNSVHCVDAETVGQYTGLLDKDGKEIYEGGVLRFVGGTCDVLPCGEYNDQHHKKGTVLCVHNLLSGFTLCRLDQIGSDAPNEVGKVDNYFFWNHARSFEVIGNIHDNPELLTPQPETK